MVDQHTHAVGNYNSLIQNYVLSERKVKRLEEQHHYHVQSSWTSATHLAGQVLEYKTRIKTVKPVLIAGITHSNPQIVNLCWSLINSLQLAPSVEEYARLENTMLMKKEELVSWKYEQLERTRAAILASSPKTKKKVTGKKGVASAASPAKSKAKGKSDDASLTGRSVTSASSGGTAKSKKGAPPLKKPGSATGSGRGSGRNSGAPSPSPSKPSTPSVKSPPGKSPNKSPAKAKKK